MRKRFHTLLAFSLILACLAPLARAQEQSFLGRIRNAITGSSPSFHERMHGKVLAAFKDTVTETQKSTVRVYGEGGQLAMGVTVDANGLILTKYGDLVGELSCKLPDGESIRAELVGIDKARDLALLKVGRTDLTPVIWSADESSPLMGSWVVTPGNGNLPISVGVISTTSRKVPPERAFLGVQLEDVEDGVRITRLLEGGVAAKANVLRVNDVVVRIDGTEVKGLEDMKRLISGHRPNTSVKLGILRGGESVDRRVLLGRRSDAKDMVQDQRMRFQQELGGKISERRDDFPLVMQHDTVLTPQQCGSPLVNLDGEVIGVNIARASRISSYALPVSELLSAVEELKKGQGKEMIERRQELAAKMVEFKKTWTELSTGLRKAKKAHATALKERDTIRVAIKMEDKNDDDDDKLQAQLQAALDAATELKKAVKEAESAVAEVKEKMRDARAEQLSLRN